VEAFVESARRLGLNNEMSKLLVMQTIKGSLITLTRSAKSVEESRKQVTSKGGTTEAALKILTDDKFKEVFYKATHAAYNRSLELNFS
ncbi:pyrroline-5-carboxylate reductase, partial [Candidatus Roizmanbacteria bacterium CG_4_10_14_0_8_um_filter_39_9]